LPSKDDSFIYLRGIEPQEMKSILQFMYLGQATFYQDRMNEFLDVAKSLEIKEISNDVERDDVDTFRVQENDENRQVDNDIDSNDLPTSVLEDIGTTDSQVRNYKEESGKYQCDKCEKQFSHYRNLCRHRRSAHEGTRYPCNKCNQTFTQNDNLKIHIQSIHEGVKFPCNLCGHVATTKAHLYTHKKRKH